MYYKRRPHKRSQSPSLSLVPSLPFILFLPCETPKIPCEMIAPRSSCHCALRQKHWHLLELVPWLCGASCGRQLIPVRCLASPLMAPHTLISCPSLSSVSSYSPAPAPPLPSAHILTSLLPSPWSFAAAGCARIIPLLV